MEYETPQRQLAGRCGTRTHQGVRQCTIPCHTLGLPPPTGRERHLLCPPRMVMRPPVWLQCEMLQAVRGAAALRRRQSSNIARFSIAHKNRDFSILKIPVARRRPDASEF